MTQYFVFRSIHYRMEWSVEAEDTEPGDPVAALAMLQHRLEISIATGDDKQTCQLIKAMDTVKKWRGYNAHPVSPFA